MSVCEVAVAARRGVHARRTSWVSAVTGRGKPVVDASVVVDEAGRSWVASLAAELGAVGAVAEWATSRRGVSMLAASLASSRVTVAVWGVEVAWLVGAKLRSARRDGADTARRIRRDVVAAVVESESVDDVRAADVAARALAREVHDLGVESACWLRGGELWVQARGDSAVSAVEACVAGGWIIWPDPGARGAGVRWCGWSHPEVAARELVRRCQPAGLGAASGAVGLPEGVEPWGDR